MDAEWLAKNQRWNDASRRLYMIIIFSHGEGVKKLFNNSPEILIGWRQTLNYVECLVWRR